MTSPRNRLTGGAALLGVVALTAATLSTIPATADTQSDGPSSRHQANGTARGVYDHLIELQEIARANDGTRASGTEGYNASVDYVVSTLRRSGYEPKIQAFDFPFFQQLAPSTFELTAPTPTTFEENVDFALMTYSGSGDATGTVTPVDLMLGLDNTSSSGCEPEDFTGFPAGEIALVQRGACAFGQKVANAEAAGAAAAIVMNQGNTTGADRQDLFAGTLGAPVGIPAISVSYADGEQLATDKPEARIVTETLSEIRETYNVTAESRGDRQNVVMAGAHLDSVVEGEGINDNGTGSAALLESAEALADAEGRPENRVRFAWWGAEELNLLGSTHYVTELAEGSPAKFQNIALYLNYDMVGSPNYMLGVYDGDGSIDPTTDDDAGPEGSAAIERMFVRFFNKLGTGSVPTEFSGRSDYGPFIALNVPAGGLFTGAEGIKTAEEATLFGGTAGEPYDACYHQECDDLGNVSRAAVRANTAAIMHAMTKYAKSTTSVNGDETGHTPPPPAEPGPSARAHTHGVAAR